MSSSSDAVQRVETWRYARTFADVCRFAEHAWNVDVTRDTDPLCVRVSSSSGSTVVEDLQDVDEAYAGCRVVRVVHVAGSQLDDLWSRLRNAYRRIDVLDVDAGADGVAIALGIDFTLHRPLVVVVNMNGAKTGEQRERWLRMLQCNGYAFHIHEQQRVVAYDTCIIWQYWEQPHNADYIRSPCLDLCEQTVVHNAGVYRVLRLNEQSALHFIDEGVPDVIARMRRIAQRCDYVRIRLVAQYGGMWLDTDTLLLNPISPLWQRIVAEKPQLAAWTAKGHWRRDHLDVGFFAAPMHSQCMLDVLVGAQQRVRLLERDMEAQQDWGLLGTHLWAPIVHGRYVDRTLMLDTTGEVCAGVRWELNEFLYGRYEKMSAAMRAATDHAIVVPLYHGFDTMKHMDDETVRTHPSMLAHWIRHALAQKQPNDNRRTLLVVGNLALFSEHIDSNVADKMRAVMTHLSRTWRICGYGPGLSDDVSGDMTASHLVHKHNLRRGDVIFHMVRAGTQPCSIVGLADVPPGILKVIDTEDLDYEQVVVSSINNNCFDIVTYRYDCAQLDNIRRQCPRATFRLWKHYIDERYFLPVNPESKCVDILLYGNVAPHTYPFRKRLYDLIVQNNNRWRVVTLRHPGRRKDASAAGSYVGVALAKQIQSAWLVVSTPSNKDYEVKKYSEIVMAGSMPLGNLPSRSADFACNDIVPLEPSMSDAQIINTITAVLENKQQLTRDTCALQARLRTRHSFATAACDLEAIMHGAAGANGEKL